MLTIYALAGAALLRRRPRRHARDLAAVVAGQRGLRRRSHRRGRRLPDSDSAARSARRAGRRAGRGGLVDRRRASCSRRARSRRRVAAIGVVVLLVPIAGQLSGRAGFDVVDTKGHQGDRILFSKWNSFSRIGVYERDARRLVAEPRLQGPAARDAVHGHRLGGVDADPAPHADLVERAVPALRAHGARVSPEGTGDSGLGAGTAEPGVPAPSPQPRLASPPSSSAPAADAISRRRSCSARRAWTASRSTRSSPTT